MERVTGIGGIFFKAKDPAKLTEWYREHLGIQAPEGYAEFAGRDEKNPEKSGKTVWSPVPADTEYFGPASRDFMINYRVENLEAMLDQLRQKGIVIHGVEDYAYGRFAWITDPEGVRIELWEPK